MSIPELVKKITCKQLAGIDRAKTKEETVELMKKIADEKPDYAAIVGDMTGYGTVASQYGVTTFLTGSFQAINRNTGKMYKASKVFLPKDFTDVVKAAFDGRDKQNAGVHVHCTISVVKDSSSATGYTYISQPIKNPESINRDAELSAMLVSLPVPKQIAQKKAS